jgi:hypothetical protein
MAIPNGSGRLSRVLLLGGTSEIGLAIMAVSWRRDGLRRLLPVLR